MNMTKSLKYSLLTLGVLAGTSIGLANSTKASAMSVPFGNNNKVTVTPEPQKGFSVSRVGGGTGSSSVGGRFFPASSGTTFKYAHAGVDPNTGKDYDVFVKLTNFTGPIGSIGYKNQGNGISVDFTNTTGKHSAVSVKATLTFKDSKTGKQIKWDNDYMGIAFSDLEPDNLDAYYNHGKVNVKSYNQSVTSHTNLDSWNTFSDTSPKYTWINKTRAQQGIFKMRMTYGDSKKRLILPDKTYLAWKKSTKKKTYAYNPYNNQTEVEGTHSNPYLHDIWDDVGSGNLAPHIHYSGAIGVYPFDSGTHSISMTLKGSSTYNNEFLLSDVNIHPVPKSKNSIKKSIGYNNKTTTSNTLANLDDHMQYNLVATLTNAKKGTYVADNVPHRFIVSKVKGVKGFETSTHKQINDSHKFKATVTDDTFKNAKNKKVTFKLYGSVGPWVEAHPNTPLKWPFRSTGHQFQNRKIAESKSRFSGGVDSAILVGVI